MALYGDPKVGKSYAALQLAAAIVSGNSWLGFPVRQRGKVVYVQLDTPRSLWADRLDQLRQVGIDVEGIDFADRETLGAWPFDILKPEHFELLSRSLAAAQPIAVIIDTLKESHQLDENDATESQKVIAALTAATQPAAMILIHHGRKSNDSPDSLIQGSRGSSYLIGKMDAVVKMTKKSIHYVGRAIEEGTTKLERMDNGFWAPVTEDTDMAIQRVLLNPGSGREHAKTLALQLNKSEEACRSLLRRYMTNHRDDA